MIRSIPTGRLSRFVMFGLALCAADGLAVSAQAAAVVANGNFSNCGTTGTTACTASIVDGGSNTQYSVNGGETPQTVTGWTSTSSQLYVGTPGALSSGTLTLENPTSASGQAFTMNFPGLSPVGGNFLIEDTNFNAQSGQNTTNAGTLSQTLTGLTAGTDYAISFYQALTELTGFGSGTLTSFWQVGLGSSTVNSTQLTTSGYTATGWGLQTLIFEAQSATQVLSFTGMSGGGGGASFLALDGVAIVAVPEPATWALFGVGLAGLAYTRRRQNRAA